MSAGDSVAYVCGGGAAGQHRVWLSIRHLGQLFFILLLDGRGWRPEGAGVGDKAKKFMYRTGN